MKKLWYYTRKTILWAFVVAASLVFLLLLAIQVFDWYASSGKGALGLYKDLAHRYPVLRYTPSGIRYLVVGDTSKTPLMLIHGAPGGIFDWRSLAKLDSLYEKYFLLIVERPGYGATRPNAVEKSIEVQAQRLLEVLDGQHKPSVVMGWSYGGPIAIAMAAMHPEKISKVIGLAGQYDPDNEKTFGISYFIRFKIFKYILPRLLWVSNEEKLSHPEALRQVKPLLASVSTPVLLLHGDKDSIVPYINSIYLKNLLAGAPELITLKDADHGFPMGDPGMVAKYLLQ